MTSLKEFQRKELDLQFNRFVARASRVHTKTIKLSVCWLSAANFSVFRRVFFYLRCVWWYRLNHIYCLDNVCLTAWQPSQCSSKNWRNNSKIVAGGTIWKGRRVVGFLHFPMTGARSGWPNLLNTLYDNNLVHKLITIYVLVVADVSLWSLSSMSVRVLLYGAR